MDQKSYQLGGILLLLAGLTGIVGGVLHGPQPGTLEHSPSSAPRGRSPMS